MWRAILLNFSWAKIREAHDALMDCVEIGMWMISTLVLVILMYLLEGFIWACRMVGLTNDDEDSN